MLHDKVVSIQPLGYWITVLSLPILTIFSCRDIWEREKKYPPSSGHPIFSLSVIRAYSAFRLILVIMATKFSTPV